MCVYLRFESFWGFPQQIYHGFYLILLNFYIKMIKTEPMTKKSYKLCLFWQNTNKGHQNNCCYYSNNGICTLPIKRVTSFYQILGPPTSPKTKEAFYNFLLGSFLEVVRKRFFKNRRKRFCSTFLQEAFFSGRLS